MGAEASAEDFHYEKPGPEPNEIYDYDESDRGNLIFCFDDENEIILTCEKLSFQNLQYNCQKRNINVQSVTQKTTADARVYMQYLLVNYFIAEDYEPDESIYDSWGQQSQKDYTIYRTNGSKFVRPLDWSRHGEVRTVERTNRIVELLAETKLASSGQKKKTRKRKKHRKNKK